MAAVELGGCRVLRYWCVNAVSMQSGRMQSVRHVMLCERCLVAAVLQPAYVLHLHGTAAGCAAHVALQQAVQHMWRHTFWCTHRSVLPLLLLQP